jgi:hypothetical protein
MMGRKVSSLCDATGRSSKLITFGKGLRDTGSPSQWGVSGSNRSLSSHSVRPGNEELSLIGSELVSNSRCAETAGSEEDGKEYGCTGVSSSRLNP